MTITISTTVSPEFHALAREHRIKWSEAMRVGLAVIFGDLGIRPYDNKLNLVRQNEVLAEKLQKLAAEKFAVEEKLNKNVVHDGAD